MSFRYYSPRSGVCFRYQEILFTAIMCDSLGFDYNLAHKQILNIMSSPLAVKYNNDPIMLL